LELLTKIQAGNKTAFTELYSLYRNEFIVWSVRNYSCRTDEAKDVFQEVIIDFYNNAKNNKIQNLTADIKTYLFAIGKHKLLNLIKKNSKTSNFSNSELINDKLITLNNIELEHKKEFDKEQLNNFLCNIPADCKRILELYYVKEWDMESIAKELGISSTNTAKKKKFDCLKKITKFIKQSSRILVF